MNKALIAIFIIIGVGGALLGIYASIDPMGVASIFSKIGFNNTGMLVGVGVPIFFVVVFGLAFGPFVKMAMKNSAKKKRLQQIGQKGTAKILSVQDTGLTVNNSPYIKVIVEMKGTQAEFTTLVSRVGLPRPGDNIEVIYDPADPTQLMPA